MEYFGIIAFILVLSHAGLPDSLKKLKKRVHKLERINGKKGVNRMSEIIKGLVGERCKLTEISGVPSYEGTVLAADEEWIKLNIVDKKGNQLVVVKRIEDIKEISIVNK